MASTDAELSQRELILTTCKSATITSLPQKRPFEESAPSIPSPLNPDGKSLRPQGEDSPALMVREKPVRAKKDSLKKRESKAALAADASPASAPLASASLASASKTNKKSSSSPATTQPGDLAPVNLRYVLTSPKPSDFDPPKGPVRTQHHHVVDSEGRTISFYESSDHVYNKKLFHYAYCIADPTFPSSFYYRQTEPEPYGPHMSLQDSAMHVFFDHSARHVTTHKGFRMSRANVSVREGRWYWECKVTRGMVTHPSPSSTAPPGNSHGHVRIGWARKEASLDAPVGFDAYSYGFRDVHGEKVHMSRPKPFFPRGEGILEGDVIGLEIQLPSESLHRKVVSGTYNPVIDSPDHDDPPLTAATCPSWLVKNIIRDRIPTRYKGRTYFEKSAYCPTKELEDLMNPSPVASTTTRNAEFVPAAGGGTSSSRRSAVASSSNRASATNSSGPPNPNHPMAPMRTLPGSAIRLYKNGKLMGEPFTDLLAFLPPASKPSSQGGSAREGLDDGTLGYYPAVSVFRGGAAEVNFGPDFWCPPPGLFSHGGSSAAAAGGGFLDGNGDSHRDVVMTEGIDIHGGAVVDRAERIATTETKSGREAARSEPPFSRHRRMRSVVRPVSERYDDQLVEDTLWDVVDEVDFWLRDGGRVVDVVDAGGGSGNDVTNGNGNGHGNAKAVPDGGGLAKGGGGLAGMRAVGREEIKELVMDD